ncbi:MAG: hypothetical protein AB8E15_12210 [Bdellovibrionales bacterium]
MKHFITVGLSLLMASCGLNQEETAPCFSVSQSILPDGYLLPSEYVAPGPIEALDDRTNFINLIKSFDEKNYEYDYGCPNYLYSKDNTQHDRKIPSDLFANYPFPTGDIHLYRKYGSHNPDFFYQDNNKFIAVYENSSFHTFGKNGFDDFSILFNPKKNPQIFESIEIQKSYFPNLHSGSKDDYSIVETITILKCEWKTDNFKCESAHFPSDNLSTFQYIYRVDRLVLSSQTLCDRYKKHNCLFPKVFKIILKDTSYDRLETSIGNIYEN